MAKQMAETVSIIDYVSHAFWEKYDSLIPYKFPDEVYDKLVKNSAVYLDHPAVYIRSNCRDSIEIRLAAQTTNEANPLDSIRYYARRVINPSLDFTLGAVLKLGLWEPEVGFWHLAEYINYFGCHEIPFEKWVGLDINLPNEQLPFDSSRAPPFPVNKLVDLRQLKWAGHRKQLVESWLPFTPSFLDSLTSIDLTCNLALLDCSYILFYARNVKDFTLRKIRRDLASDSVFGFSLPTYGIQRPCLESLTLESEDDIAPLLEPFHFTSLRSVTFNLQYPRVSSLHGLLFWKTIETVIMEEYIPYNDMQGIRSLCRPETGFFHKDVNSRYPPKPYTGGIAENDDDGEE
ncbi:hypothetical protein H0H93_015776 [Arthromyces matolae]|nr:hypothetical protein H0H93_015776 [Arthromyces matolae]